MKPGRELDALVAEKVMGLTQTGQPYPSEEDVWWHKPRLTWEPCALPQYSTDIAAAWKVVERLRSLECFIDCELTSGITENTALLDDGSDYPKKHWFFSVCVGNGYVTGAADTAPHAICLAALKAVGVEV